MTAEAVPQRTMTPSELRDEQALRCIREHGEIGATSRMITRETGLSDGQVSCALKHLQDQDRIHLQKDDLTWYWMDGPKPGEDEEDEDDEEEPEDLPERSAGKVACPLDGCLTKVRDDRAALKAHLQEGHGLSVVEVIAYLDKLYPLSEASAECNTECNTLLAESVIQDVIQQPEAPAPAGDDDDPAPPAQDPVAEASAPKGSRQGMSAERARQIDEENAKIKALYSTRTVKEMSEELDLSKALIYDRIAAMKERGELAGEGVKVKTGRPPKSKKAKKEERAEEPKPPLPVDKTVYTDVPTELPTELPTAAPMAPKPSAWAVVKDGGMYEMQDLPADKVPEREPPLPRLPGSGIRAGERVREQVTVTECPPACSIPVEDFNSCSTVAPAKASELRRLCDLAVAMEELARNRGMRCSVSISTESREQLTVRVSVGEGER